MTRPSAFVLTAHPLSHAFREQLEQARGVEPEYMSVPELRRLGIRALIGTLAQLRGRPCVIALEDPGSEPLLPLLQGYAAAAFPSSIEVVRADLRSETISRRRVATSAIGVGRASVAGFLARRAAAASLETLLREPRIAAVPGPSRNALMVNSNLWFGVKAGGSLAHTGGVANGLAGAGYDVDLIAPFAVPELHAAVSEHPGLPPTTFALPTEDNNFRYDQTLHDHALRIARARQPRFVYHRLSIHSHVGARLSRSLGVPLVVEYNGSEVWVARHWGRPLRYERLAEQAERVLLRHAHVVVTVSDVLRDELLDRGVDERRIVTYPNCVDTTIFDPSRFEPGDRSALRRRHGVPDDALVATFVGTFGRWHGADVLAAAIRTLSDEAPGWLEERRLHFLFVGDGLRMSEVESILGGRQGRFHTLAGLIPQAETPRYLDASDIVLSPHVPNADGSRFFGSPTKLFEYMAMGLPIVASELDQIGDVLRPSLRASDLPSRSPDDANEVAVVTTPGSERELVAGIRFLADRADWRSVLGSNARRLATERYTWEAHVAAILARLDEV
jgi:glycosyltransferase involved in cell wall biosynthesis